jgi:DNA-binding NarL/FixJ family response regulator
VVIPVMDGIEATQRMCQGDVGTGPRILALTTFDTDVDTLAALRAGASRFLLNVPAEESFRRSAWSPGRGSGRARIMRRLLDRFAGRLRPPSGDGRLGLLSERQREVLLIAPGVRSRHRRKPVRLRRGCAPMMDHYM